MRITPFVTTLAVLAGSPLVDAALVLPVLPFAQYRFAFVTSMGMAANSSDIADYNDFVTDLANAEPALEGLSTTWTVIASTASVSARDNTMTDPSPPGDTGFPIFTLDGSLIAATYEGLWDGTLDQLFVVTDTGGSYLGPVWTGSTEDGSEDVPFTLGFGQTARGNSQSITSWITTGIAGVEDSNLSFPFYAISGVLTAAAVPEPSAFLCVCCLGGLLGLGSLSWKKLKSRRVQIH